MSRSTAMEMLESRRLLSAGGIDPYFGANGQTTLQERFSSVSHLLVAHDGRIISIRAGERVTVNGVSHSTLAINRYRSNGSPDVFDVAPTWVLPPLASREGARRMPAALDANDRLFVANEGRIYCILPSGSFDRTFGDAGHVNSPFTSQIDGLLAQADGKILVYGEQLTAAGVAAGICRITAFGKRDPSFGPKGVRYATDFVNRPGYNEHRNIRHLVQDSTGRIIADVEASSDFGDYVNTFGAEQHTLMRFNADGTRDDTLSTTDERTAFHYHDHFVFAPHNVVVSQEINGTTLPADITVDSRNRLVVLLNDVNEGDPAHDAVMRLLPDGSLDTSFAGDGLLDSFFDNRHPELTAINVLPNGKLLVSAELAGPKINSFDTTDDFLIQLNDDGTPDGSFGTAGVLAVGNLRSIQRLLPAPDGTLLISERLKDSISGFPNLYVLRRLWTAEAPVATLSFRNITSPTNRPQALDVTYRDDGVIDLATLDNRDLRVTGPNGFVAYARFLGVTSSINNNGLITARYRLSAPGGSWDASDNGLFSVRLIGNQVSDTNGHASAGRMLGQFLVRIRATVRGLTKSAAAQHNFDADPSDLIEELL